MIVRKRGHKHQPVLLLERCAGDLDLKRDQGAIAAIKRQWYHIKIRTISASWN
jgi:hypothetical protein